MKKAILILVFLQLFFFNLASAQSFFPLKVGNKYQKKIDWSSDSHGTYDLGTEYTQFSVSRDTLINGVTFFNLKGAENQNPFPGNNLYSYDSLSQKLFIRIPDDDTLRLAVDFNAPADSHYISYIQVEPVEFTSYGTSPLIAWGDSLLSYSMHSKEGEFPQYYYLFLNEIGLYKYEYYNANFFYYFHQTDATLSAIIDSVIYNPLILKIDTLKPVIDRPINTFPYILTVSYHVDYYKLIDDFFITLNIERNSSIVFSQDYNVSVSNPNLQLNPANLEVGDIIKLRATITDTSIYNNIDVYPDTDWVSFQVLSSVSGVDENGPIYFYKLEQNYPNPFNPISIIKYEIRNWTFVSLKVYDILGNEVAVLVNEVKSAGSYEVYFNAANLSSGVYIYQLQTPEFTKTRKMILTK